MRLFNIPKKKGTLLLVLYRWKGLILGMTQEQQVSVESCCQGVFCLGQHEYMILNILIALCVVSDFRICSSDPNILLSSFLMIMSPQLHQKHYQSGCATLAGSLVEQSWQKKTTNPSGNCQSQSWFMINNIDNTLVMNGRDGSGSSFLCKPFNFSLKGTSILPQTLSRSSHANKSFLFLVLISRKRQL